MLRRKSLSFFILSTFFLFGTIFSFDFLKLLSSGLSRCIRCCYHQNFQQSRSWSRRSIHFHCRRCYLLYKRHGLRPICKQQLCFRRTFPSNSSGYLYFPHCKELYYEGVNDVFLIFQSVPMQQEVDMPVTVMVLNSQTQQKKSSICTTDCHIYYRWCTFSFLIF